MPQIYNLGGMSIQKTQELRINSLKSADGLTPYIEVLIDPDDNIPMVYLRNIKEIHCHDGTTTLDAEQIDTTDT